MFKFDKNKIPKSAGVYIFKNKENKIIYIGKAKNLQKRVSSYFLLKHENSIKTRFLVKNITNLDFIAVDTELEAFLLENKLIKKHKPKYNINLKDNKTYPYIIITNEKIPKIFYTRKTNIKGDYFGPFVDGIFIKEIIKLVVEIFHLITPRTFSSNSTLYHQIGLAPAKNIKEIDEKKYLKNVQDAKEFLKGKNISKIKKQLISDMKISANKLQFEIALEKKRQVYAIEKFQEKQKVDLIKNYDQDIIVMIQTENDKRLNKVSIQILNILKGVITSKNNYKIDYEENVFSKFLRSYYTLSYIPKEIIINLDFWKSENEKKIIEEFLSLKKGKKIKLIKPLRGEKLSLINLALKNIRLELKTNILEEIKIKLNLKSTPKIIECFDMSNFGSKDLVGAMTRFVDEKRDENGSRKYNIKSFSDKNDDYASIREVIYRRYKKLKDEKKQLPNLIIIDGGKGHLKSAKQMLKLLRLTEKIDIISIAKGKDRDKNEIYIDENKKPLIFEDNLPMMLYLRKVRDSVHNLVINFNRSKRKIK